MFQSSALTCLACGYSWKPRKNVTRYRRQCPRCKHTRFNEDNGAGSTQRTSPPAAASISQNTGIGTRWPKIVYDLMGISDSSSPENALARAYELYRKLLPFKFKYGLENVEKVFEFLERTAVDQSRKASEAEERLQGILESPELIFYETVGSDLGAVNWYEALQKEGYKKNFLDFLSEIADSYFSKQGLELGFRYNRT